MKTLLEALKELREAEKNEPIPTPLKIVIGRNTAREWVRHFGPLPPDYIVHNPDVEGMKAALAEWKAKNSP